MWEERIYNNSTKAMKRITREAYEKIRSEVLYCPVENILKYSCGKKIKIIKNKRYCLVIFDKQFYLLHRFLWIVLFGDPKKNLVDHIDGDGFNNHPDNLRLATPHENQTNRKKLNINNKSGYTGIYWESKNKKWRAQIFVKGKNISLGFHETRDEAIRARIEAEEAHHWLRVQVMPSSYLI